MILMLKGIFCTDLFSYNRLPTRVVKVGDIGIGGNNPVRIQSMTSTDTMNTLKTVEQSIRMIEAGCELVRITAPSINEARNLKNIKEELKRKGFHTPLVADIHFTPNAAEMAARIVEKVRINPGNYVDKKKFETIDYTDQSYNEELERIRERFIPLIKICKEYGTAMRIGCNHGSLSDRIMSRYGDTPFGMVESALEFLRICRAENYHQVVLSMKASSLQIMVQANRLLVQKMTEEFSSDSGTGGAICYPLHLGVTEAGDGEDGRIKSAGGIGTLLEDGIGDTIRVSLTEDPEFEIPVALAMVKRYEPRASTQSLIPGCFDVEKCFKPFDYERRKTETVNCIGGKNVPRVIIDLSKADQLSPASLFATGYQYSIPNNKWKITDQAVDFVYTGTNSLDFELPGELGVIQLYQFWKLNPTKRRHFPLMNADEFLNKHMLHPELNFIQCYIKDTVNELFIARLKSTKEKSVLVLKTSNAHGMAEQRRFFFECLQQEIQCPVIISRSYSRVSENEFLLYSATDVAGVMLNGMGDGVFLKADFSPSVINRTSFGILQACRTRISKTEYISCPSCGRTQFDLQEVSARIRARTHHLKGVKIGIMGCIVNGPGEMADADYGYVGTGSGKITLYKGKTVVKRNIPEAEAVDALIELIREHGDWVQPESQIADEELKEPGKQKVSPL